MAILAGCLASRPSTYVPTYELLRPGDCPGDPRSSCSWSADGQTLVLRNITRAFPGAGPWTALSVNVPLRSLSVDGFTAYGYVDGLSISCGNCSVTLSHLTVLPLMQPFDAFDHRIPSAGAAVRVAGAVVAIDHLKAAGLTNGLLVNATAQAMIRDSAFRADRGTDMMVGGRLTLSNVTTTATGAMFLIGANVTLDGVHSSRDTGAWTILADAVSVSQSKFLAGHGLFLGPLHGPFGSSPLPTAFTVRQSTFAGNRDWGLLAGEPVDAALNYWASPTGPSTRPLFGLPVAGPTLGNGDAVNDYVAFAPFLPSQP